MPLVRFEPSGKEVVANDGEKVIDLVKRLHLPLESVCGGRGTCGRCRVQVISGDALITDEDRRRIKSDELSSGVRLACQLRADDELIIRILQPHASSKHVILERTDAKLELDPSIRRIKVRVADASIAAPTSLESRFLEALGQKGIAPARMPLSMITALSKAISEDLELQVLLRRDEVVALGKEEGKGTYGIAVDVGSTTVVAYLMDLLEGTELAVHSQLNPQIEHGDDVISRITFSITDPKGREELQRLIIGCINHLIGECSRTAGVPLEEILEVMLVGNTAMHHSVFGLDQKALALVPFAPITTQALEFKARDVGIHVAQEGYACALPNVAGFVGADHIGVLLATDLDELDKPTMVIDIGTNGEISVGDRRGIVSASVAAGPAFEGGNLSSGMRGADGAIDHVTIGQDMELEYTTIGDVKPRGLCGSGVIDLVAEMFLSGLIDRTGHIQTSRDPSRVRKEGGQMRYVLAGKEETADGQEVSISQDDIVQIQFAKGALHAASEILMERRNVRVEELDSILLAGAFGNFVNPVSARTLGMFPEVPLDSIKGIGNAAGAGAKLALLSERKREKAKRLARDVDYIELAAMPDFEDRFFSSLYFPHAEASKFPEALSLLRKGK